MKSERGYLVPEHQGQYGSKRILGAEAAFIVADAMSESATLMPNGSLRIAQIAEHL